MRTIWIILIVLAVVVLAIVIAFLVFREKQWVPLDGYVVWTVKNRMQSATRTSNISNKAVYDTGQYQLVKMSADAELTKKGNNEWMLYVTSYSVLLPEGTDFEYLPNTGWRIKGSENMVVGINYSISFSFYSEADAIYSLGGLLLFKHGGFFVLNKHASSIITVSVQNKYEMRQAGNRMMCKTTGPLWYHEGSLCSFYGVVYQNTDKEVFKLVAMARADDKNVYYLNKDNTDYMYTLDTIRKDMVANKYNYISLTNMSCSDKKWFLNMGDLEKISFSYITLSFSGVKAVDYNYVVSSNDAFPYDSSAKMYPGCVAATVGFRSFVIPPNVDMSYTALYISVDSDLVVSAISGVLQVNKMNLVCYKNMVVDGTCESVVSGDLRIYDISRYSVVCIYLRDVINNKLVIAGKNIFQDNVYDILNITVV